MRISFVVLFLSFQGFLFSQDEDTTLLITPCNCIGADTEFTPWSNNGSDFYRSFSEGYEFQIFNRWGEIIFETADTAKAWIPGYETIDGVYIWQIKGTVETDENLDGILELEEVAYRGHITLLK